MRFLLLIAALLPPLAAQSTFTIVAIERRGLPPYEDDRRLYRLDGGEERDLRPGDFLVFRRAGQGIAGRLRVTEVRKGWSLAVLDAAPFGAPMRGDSVQKTVLARIPDVPAPPPDLPKAAAVPLPGTEAPPREGLLWFLPASAELSPAGQAKLAAWVEAWGREGRWRVVVGTARTATEALREARGKTLAELLRAVHVEAEVLLEDRSADGPNHPTWIQRRE